MHCQNSRQYNMLHYGKTTIEPITMLSSLLCDAVFFSLFLGSCCLSCHNRGALRERYGIDGSGCSDCMASLFCFPLVTCQNYREMSLRAEWPTAFCLEKPFAIRPPLMAMMGGTAYRSEQ
jgi:Cys-rich protein (TIGR01571 family)